MSEKIKLRLTSDIEYEIFDGCADHEQLRKDLAAAAKRVIEHGMGNGFFSGEEEACADTHSVNTEWITTGQPTMEEELAYARQRIEKLERGCIELSYALGRIDYICSAPNEYEVSDYDVHQNEDLVITAVERKLAELVQAKATIDELMAEYPLALRELALRTNTVPGDWVTEDGPDSGVGEDYYYRHCDRNEVWWVCVDQGEVTHCVLEQN
jgi:hypothetical protein